MVTLPIHKSSLVLLYTLRSQGQRKFDANQMERHKARSHDVEESKEVVEIENERVDKRNLNHPCQQILYENIPRQLHPLLCLLLQDNVEK